MQESSKNETAATSELQLQCECAVMCGKVQHKPMASVSAWLAQKLKESFAKEDSLDPNSRLTLAQVVALITPGIQRKDEVARDAENRVRHTIAYAVKKGSLKKESSGKFIFADISFWAGSKWPGKFDDLPGIARMNLTLPKLTMSSLVFPSPPTSIEECHQLLVASYHRIATLEKEVSDLKPDAEIRRANCQTNRRSASKKGRGKI